MTSANQTGAEGECYDLSTADEGTHDTHTTHERPNTQPAGTDAGFMDQEGPAFTVKEKESNFLAHEFIPSSSHTLGSEQHISEELKYLTQEGLEPDVKTTTPKPAQAFTDKSTASQSHGQGLNPAERLQEPETEQFLENKRSDQEDLKQDDENPMTQRSCEYDPEEGMPAVVVTQPGEVSSDQAEDINLSAMHEDMVHSDSSRNASPSDGTELSSSDLLSLKSDTISLISEAAISCKSLFHREQMDPIEKEWLRCAVLGNASTLYLLLQQDPTLISKKDFVTTALHWAAKQGRVEMADMMACSGVDVNQRALKSGSRTPEKR